MQISYGTPCTEESLRLEQTTLKVIFLSSGCPRQKKNRQDEARFGLWGSKHLYLEYGRKVPNTGTRLVFGIE